LELVAYIDKSIMLDVKLPKGEAASTDVRNGDTLPIASVILESATADGLKAL
jgi:hypothetical protein